MQLLEQDENIIGVSGGWWQGPVFAYIEILASAPLRHTPGPGRPGRQVPRLQLQPITLQIQGVMFSTVQCTLYRVSPVIQVSVSSTSTFYEPHNKSYELVHIIKQ